MMPLLTHHDASLPVMRTTITLADDVAASLEKLRRERGLGLSEAVNDLVRAGLTVEQPARAFRQTTHDLGDGVDFSNIGETLETLDGPASR
jgi:Ribbon-helix-helix protein, copG family